MAENNKDLGTKFENETVKLLSAAGYWAHFITPNIRGAQPFDVIAVKGGSALAIDCKTSAKKVFPITRLEDNQITAFEKWLRSGNMQPVIFVKYGDDIYCLKYLSLKLKKKIDLLNDPDSRFLQLEEELRNVISDCKQ